MPEAPGGRQPGGAAAGAGPPRPARRQPARAGIPAGQRYAAAGALPAGRPVARSRRRGRAVGRGAADRNAPYAQWLARACAHLARADGDTRARSRPPTCRTNSVHNGANGCRRRACGCRYACLRNRTPARRRRPAAGRRRSRRADAAAAADRVEPHLVPCGPCSAPGPGPGRLAQPRPLAARRGGARRAPPRPVGRLRTAGGWRDSGAPVGAGAGRTGRRATRRAARRWTAWSRRSTCSPTRS